MTNEEASCVLHCPDAYGGIYGQKYGEALAHCFELLKQQPCEDAVSRQAALDACDQSINIFDATDRIKELPSVKPKVKECEDCVSRKWLKNAIHNFYKGLIHTPTEEDIQAYIDVAPSVKPQYTEAEIQNMQEMEQAEIQKAYELGKAEQPKIGHWKRVSADKYVQHATYYYRCSECDNDIIGEHNYCPHCGAKMEEEQDAH